MASRESTVTAHEAQAALARLLLERVRRDRYPSWTHMQILEEMLPPSMHRDYLNVLLEKVISDSQPSIPMIRRIARIAQSL
jgi:hypothetical protein